MQDVAAVNVQHREHTAVEPQRERITWSVIGDHVPGRVFTKRDSDLLGRTIKAMRLKAAGDDLEAIERLSGMLLEGQVVSPKNIPCDIVTLNSKVLLEEEYSCSSIAVTLVRPEAADRAKNKISVLSSLGMSILGLRIRTEIEFRSRAGIQRIKVGKILYQPEAFGRYDS